MILTVSSFFFFFVQVGSSIAPLRYRLFTIFPLLLTLLFSDDGADTYDFLSCKAEKRPEVSVAVIPADETFLLLYGRQASLSFTFSFRRVGR